MPKKTAPAMRRRIVAACLWIVILGLLWVSCVGDESQPKKPQANRPPVISLVYHDPDRVLRNHRVRAIAVTSDPDGDRLGHIWTADRGSFPAGFGQRAVTWLSPEEPGPSTLYLSVTDGEFTVRDSMVVVPSDLAPPPGMNFAVGPSVVDLIWERSQDEGIDHWQGYEIFMTHVPISTIPEEERHRYRTALHEGGSRQLRIGRLRNGTLYYFSAGSLRGWGGWIEAERRWETEDRSGPGSEVVVAPRPEWIVITTELAHLDGAFALDMSAGMIRPLNVHDPSGVPDRDLYFGTSDPMDGPGPLRMKSVSLLANRNEAWSDRVVRFKPLGTDWEVNTVTDDGWMEQVPVQRDLVYAVLLPEGNYAKIQVTSIDGVSPNRLVQLRWAYQTIPGFPVF